MRTTRLDANTPARPAINPIPKEARFDAKGLNGKTLTVHIGQSLVLNLPPQPANGYQWVVMGTSRSFGYPQEAKQGPSNKVGGAPRSETFTWAIDDSMQAGSTHEVTIGLKRPWEAKAAETISFTVNVIR